MCRMVAYFGPPLPLSTVLDGPPHSLIRQSYAPGEMTCGLLNADGWGVGWFAPGLGPRPGVLKGTLPIWSDVNAVGATHAIAAASFVAVIRSASPLLGIAPANTPPYLWDEDRLLVHNGRLWPWPAPLARELRARMEPEDEAAILGTTDTEVLGALWRSEVRRAPDGDVTEALRATLRTIRDRAWAAGGGVAANLILADASGFLAVRYAEPGPPPSLYLAREVPGWAGGTLVASEPLDDAPWLPVPASTLLRVDAQGVSTEPLAL